MMHENIFAFSEHALHRATRAFNGAFYEDAVRDAYFSSLDAAKRIVAARNGVRPVSHSGTRKRLSSLIDAGLSVQRDSIELLSRGYGQVLGEDHCGRFTIVDRAHAADYLNRAAAFIAAAKAVCG